MKKRSKSRNKKDAVLDKSFQKVNGKPIVFWIRRIYIKIAMKVWTWSYLGFKKMMKSFWKYDNWYVIFGAFEILIYQTRKRLRY